MGGTPWGWLRVSRGSIVLCGNFCLVVVQDKPQKVENFHFTSPTFVWLRKNLHVKDFPDWKVVSLFWNLIDKKCYIKTRDLKAFWSWIILVMQAESIPPKVKIFIGLNLCNYSVKTYLLSTYKGLILGRWMRPNASLLWYLRVHFVSTKTM